jgi:hypothetical protein
VHRFSVAHLIDLDYVNYLLNFTGIEVGVNASGEWSVYFRQACRHLSAQDGSCSLHGTDDQPLVCQHYNPYQCWYKRVMTVPASDDFLRVDRRRLYWLLERVRYDEQRRVTESPSWHSMVAVFADLPLEVTPLPHPPAPEVVPAGRSSLPLQPISTAPRRFGELTAATPCTDCSAYCCTRVEFPLEVPRTVAALDFVKFSLGFLGVEVGVTDDGWKLVVNTTCSNLVGNRCRAFGMPERPIKCSYYDAWRCTHRRDYAPDSAAAIVRVPLEQYDRLLDLVPIAADGAVISTPTPEQLRHHLAATPATGQAGWPVQVAVP